MVAGNIFLVLRALDAQPLDCGFGALLFLAYTGTFFRGYVAIDEPQWLGHALETGGLVIFLKSRWRAAGWSGVARAGVDGDSGVRQDQPRAAAARGHDLVRDL